MMKSLSIVCVSLLSLIISGSCFASETSLFQVLTGRMMAKNPIPLLSQGWKVIRQDGSLEIGFRDIPAQETVCGIALPPGEGGDAEIQTYWNLQLSVVRGVEDRFMMFRLYDGGVNSVLLLCGKGFDYQSGLFLGMPSVSETKALLAPYFSVVEFSY